MDPVERAGSGLKLIGFARAGSIESGEKTNDMHLLPNEHGQSTLLQAPGYDDIPKEIQAGADVKKKLLISSLVAKDPAMKVNWNLDGPAEGADGLL
ncbi:uncharacterized protein LOC108227838 isoform X2 [Daucus carota subsp. sativus]|uniref:uncharacterized protein LOC108227837 isoform X2 n=1 Tax=Daucus carota subsp. sativus TaxID=79200 RepID=UPI003082FE4E